MFLSCRKIILLRKRTQGGKFSSGLDSKYLGRDKYFSLFHIYLWWLNTLESMLFSETNESLLIVEMV